MLRTHLAMLLGVAVASLAGFQTAFAQSVCRPADANSAKLIQFLGRYTSATAGDDLLSRNVLKLPAAPTSQLSIVTQNATCRKARTTYEAHATAQGGTGLSGRPYVIKIGTAYAVVDPSYHGGPDVGWWLIVTMDSKFKKLSYTTTHFLSS